MAVPSTASPQSLRLITRSVITVNAFAAQNSEDVKALRKRERSDFLRYGKTAAKVWFPTFRFQDPELRTGN
jgi:hypothetical protein